MTVGLADSLALFVFKYPDCIVLELRDDLAAQNCALYSGLTDPDIIAIDYQKDVLEIDLASGLSGQLLEIIGLTGLDEILLTAGFDYSKFVRFLFGWFWLFLARDRSAFGGSFWLIRFNF